MRCYVPEGPAVSTEKQMKRILLTVAVAALYVLHQDVWNWRTPRPLVFGFVPIGLFYHACFAAAASLLMWLLVTYAWPAHLEREAEEAGEGKGGEAR
jgi:hypothetical protein